VEGNSQVGLPWFTQNLKYPRVPSHHFPSKTNNHHFQSKQRLYLDVHPISSNKWGHLFNEQWCFYIVIAYYYHQTTNTRHFQAKQSLYVDVHPISPNMWGQLLYSSYCILLVITYLTFTTPNRRTLNKSFCPNWETLQIVPQIFKQCLRIWGSYYIVVISNYLSHIHHPK
jgi:Iap family predicted aminopeptidase